RKSDPFDSNPLEDQMFRQIMAHQQDDQPDRDRLANMEQHFDDRHQPMSGKQRILAALGMIAPVALGGIFGGAAGAGGAGEGVEGFEQKMHDRHMQEDQIERAQMEAERGRQEHRYERELQIPIAYSNLQLNKAYKG